MNEPGFNLLNEIEKHTVLLLNHIFLNTGERERDVKFFSCLMDKIVITGIHCTWSSSQLTQFLKSVSCVFESAEKS